MDERELDDLMKNTWRIARTRQNRLRRIVLIGILVVLAVAATVWAVTPSAAQPPLPVIR